MSLLRSLDLSKISVEVQKVRVSLSEGSSGLHMKEFKYAITCKSHFTCSFETQASQPKDVVDDAHSLDPFANGA